MATSSRSTTSSRGGGGRRAGAPSVARIPYVRDNEATAEAAAALEDVRRRRGFVSGVQRLLAHSVPALEAYEQLSRFSVVSRLDARTRELVILRVAQLLGNAYAWRRHVPRGIEATLSMPELAL